MAERCNVSELVDHNLAAGRAGKVVIHWSRGRLTYGQLHGLLCATAQRLRDLGIRREERVLLAMDDSPALVAAFLGAIRIGAVPVPVNPLLQRSEDYDHYLEDSLARVVVVDESTAEKVGAAAARVSSRTGGRTAASPGILTAEEILALGPIELDPVNTRRDDMAFWLYSSGSTGKPKAVVHLQHDIEYTCESYARHVLGIGVDDVTFSTTKLFHAYG
ncbi:MAG: AMP-binding protein, partial [Candidatus Dormibacteraeota bacterium]|nr:AMP-binding protein [Candidatus Dormibacteraeota bacterium]